MKSRTAISIILFTALYTTLKTQTGTLTGWGMSVCQQFSFGICSGEIITPFDYGTQPWACNSNIMPDVSFVNQGTSWRVAQHNWDFVASGSTAEISGLDQSNATISWTFAPGAVLSPSVYSMVNGFEYITFAINNSTIPFMVQRDNFQIQLTATTTPISANSTTICAGQNTTLTASGATSYSWNPGNLTGTSVQVNPVVTTVYSITATNGLCTYGKSQATVTVKPAPLVSIAGNTLVCRGKSVSLTASGAQSYSWNQGGTLPTITVTPITTSSYTVNGTNANGCNANAVITVSVSECLGLIDGLQDMDISVFPNPFTDKINMVNTGNVSIESVIITDVLGKVVYNAHELLKSEKLFQLPSLPSGLYFLKIEGNGRELIYKLMKE